MQLSGILLAGGMMRKIRSVSYLMTISLLLVGCSEPSEDSSEEEMSSTITEVEPVEEDEQSNAGSSEKDDEKVTEQETEKVESQFDAITQAEILFDRLDGAGGFPWMMVGEDPYEGAPVLIAMPEEAFSDSLQGCVVTAFDPEVYEYSTRINEIEGVADDLPGQAIWMGDSEGLKVELRAFSAEAACWQPSKERLGWDSDMEPTFIFPNQETEPEKPAVETVSMPDLVGVTESEAKTWLSRNNYKFNVNADYGFNPRLSLCVGGKGLVTGQSPSAGSEVKNEFGTFVRLQVDCEWR